MLFTTYYSRNYASIKDACLMQGVQNAKEEKRRNYFKILLPCILGVICFKFDMHICLVWGHLSSKFG